MKHAITVQQRTADYQCASYLRQLRAHMYHCNKCKGAISASEPHLMCRKGINLVLSAAKYADYLWKVKLAAYNDPGGAVYVCPDISAHGDMAETTACPVIVTAYSPKLF